MRLLASVAARVTVFTLAIGILLAVAAIFGIDFTARMYHQEANQRLHQDLAGWLVNQYHFQRDGHIDTTGIALAFGDAMRVNPSIEVYLVDTAGRILAFNAPQGRVKLDRIDMEPVFRFVESRKMLPIFGTDPRNPDARQVFSAAPIQAAKDTIGYTYVVVGGELYQDLVSRLRFSRILQTAAVGAGAVILAGAISGFAGFWFFTRRITGLTSDIERFSRSGFTVLPASLPIDRPVAAADELDRLRTGFAELARVIHEQVLKLQSADLLLREAIAALSHDLRTPLTALGGYLETIKMRGDELSSSESDSYVDLALAQHRRLTHLVRAQFDLAMLNSSAFPFDPQYASLSDLVHDVGHKFMATAKAAGVDLIVNSPPAGVYANVDLGLLERALENLISNAVRHTPPGGQVEMLINEDSSRIAVCVKDTGSGIPATDLPHIFDRYFRGANAAKSPGQGAGLGLAIAKRILELHGGDIVVTSAAGAGAEFCCYLTRLQRRAE
jgi:two-component system OmpR family sensor kinase